MVTIDFTLTPVDGFVPLPLFDWSGKVSFCLGWGNYLPGLHDLAESMVEGQECHNIILDAGWGSRNPELVVEILKSKLSAVKDLSRIKVGTTLHLRGGIQVEVIHVKEDSIVVDANPPLAGASYSCDVKLLSVEPIESRFEVTTFALGCYWAGELAFMRVPGVVGTKVGYTQGIQRNPTYEQVCTGETKHREAIYVVFDPTIVTYQSLARIALGRLAMTTSDFQLSKLFNDDVIQYKHGFYFHTEEQRVKAQEILKDKNKYHVELLAAAEFYDAEESHQQYLFKGGQSAKKGCQDTIRCFG